MRCVCLSCVVIVLVAACGEGHAEGHAEERHDTSAHHVGAMPVTKPVRQSTEIVHEYVGQVRAVQHIELRALERGYVEGIFVDEGQLIKAGQRMFQIMPRLQNAEVSREQAEVSRAEIELNNTSALAQKNIVSPNELSLAKATFDRAQAQLDLAKARRGFTDIRAPFTGIMGRFAVRLGSLVDEGELLTTMSDTSTLWVYFNVSEAQYLRFKSEPDAMKRPVHLRMANGEVFAHAGSIETIDADFNSETGTVAVRAAFPNPDGLLRHGQTGKVMLTEPLPDALLIPAKASFQVLDRSFVFVVDEHGVVHARAIAIFAELPRVLVIKHGLTESDVVLLEGLRKVQDGQHIQTVAHDPHDVLSHLEVHAE